MEVGTFQSKLDLDTLTQKFSKKDPRQKPKQKKKKTKNHNNHHQKPIYKAEHDYLNNYRNPSFLVSSLCGGAFSSSPHSSLEPLYNLRNGIPTEPWPLCDELDGQASLDHMGTLAWLSWEPEMKDKSTVSPPLTALQLSLNHNPTGIIPLWLQF